MLKRQAKNNNRILQIAGGRFVPLRSSLFTTLVFPRSAKPLSVPHKSHPTPKQNKQNKQAYITQNHHSVAFHSRLDPTQRAARRFQQGLSLHEVPLVTIGCDWESSVFSVAGVALVVESALLSVLRSSGLDMLCLSWPGPVLPFLSRLL